MAVRRYILSGQACSESLWFPMRVTYGRSLPLSRELSGRGVEYFLPSDASGHPLISNLIFVHSTKEELKSLKSEPGLCSAMSFMTYVPHYDLPSGGETRIIVVPEEDMDRFKTIVESCRENLTLIPFSESFEHIGRRIRIVDGPLRGTEGVLRRIKKNRHVHIDCGGVLVAQLEYTPSSMYQLLD